MKWPNSNTRVTSKKEVSNEYMKMPRELEDKGYTGEAKGDDGFYRINLIFRYSETPYF